ncbi:hypothetical protein EVA_09521 [gut metagenome]|uniref:Uncharacterized protein n=1 Tax=gut metagenome TaxID=749906 RepID=J9GJX6_9ZZZZ
MDKTTTTFPKRSPKKETLSFLKTFARQYSAQAFAAEAESQERPAQFSLSQPLC